MDSIDFGSKKHEWLSLKAVIYKLVPTTLLSLLYIIDMATDIAVSARLFKAGPLALWGGCVSITLILLPILVYNLHEVIVTVIKHKCSYHQAAFKIIQFAFCPVIALLRFGEKIFWLVETATAKTVKDKELAMLRANEPRRIELYLFLRSILQAMPQSFLQMYLLIYLGDIEIRMIQMLSVLFSIISASVLATNYQRFESQEFKYFPWNKYERIFQDSTDSHAAPKVVNNQASPEEIVPLKTIHMSLQETQVDVNIDNSHLTRSLPRKFRYANTEQAQLSIKAEIPSSIQVVIPLNSEQIDRECDSPSPPPIPPRNSAHITPARPPSKHIQTPTDNTITNDREKRSSRVSFLRHSYAESSASNFKDNRRSSYHYLPVSINGSSNRSSEVKALSVPDFNAPPVPNTNSLTVALPTRKTGKKFVRPETRMSYVVSLLKWFLFIGSRLIAVCGLFALRHSSLTIMLITLGVIILHCILMHIIITVNCDQTQRAWWKSGILSVTSLFCLLEIGTKFEKFSRIITVYWPMCFVENIVAGFIAYEPHQIIDIAEWWFAYLFYTMFTTYILSTACFMFHYYILTPKKYVLYEE